MEAGVHIGKGSIKHLPEDYVVPLFKEGDASFWRRESLLLPKVRRLVMSWLLWFAAAVLVVGLLLLCCCCYCIGGPNRPLTNATSKVIGILVSSTTEGPH